MAISPWHPYIYISVRISAIYLFFKNSGILILSFDCTVGLAGFGDGATCGSTGAAVLVVFGTTGFAVCDATPASDRKVGRMEDDPPSACPP